MSDGGGGGGVLLGTPAGVVGQLANLSFLCAGVFADLLIIRLCLLLGYCGLLANALTGFPLWPGFVSTPHFVALDTVVWSLLGIYVHGASFVHLLRDERAVHLSEPEEELYRMFYRRSGITRLLFKSQVLAGAEFREYAPGDVITDGSTGKRVHIVIQGHVDATVTVPDGSRSFQLFSGDLFEFRYLNLFGTHVGFVEADMVAIARSEVRTFSIEAERLRELSRGPSIVRQAWQAVIVAAMARAAERSVLRAKHSRPRDGRAQPQRRGRSSAAPSDEDVADAFAAKLADAASETGGSVEAGGAATPRARARAPTSAELQAWRDPAFRPFEPDEMPPAYSPGSDRFWRAPLSNVAMLALKTLALPPPCGRHFAGLRHAAGLPRKPEDVAQLSETMRFLRAADSGAGAARAARRGSRGGTPLTSGDEADGSRGGSRGGGRRRSFPQLMGAASPPSPRAAPADGPVEPAPLPAAVSAAEQHAV